MPIYVKTAGFGRIRQNSILRRALAPILDWVNRRVTGFLLSRAVGVDACTNKIVADIKDVAPNAPVELIPNSVDTSVFLGRSTLDRRGPFFGEDVFVLGYIGGDPMTRGAKEVMDVTLSLRGQGYNVGAIIVGGDQKGVMSYASKRHIGDLVRALGPIDYKDVPRVMRRLDVGFAFDDLERYEVVGNSYQKIRQYISSGVPVISYYENSDATIDSEFVNSFHPDDVNGISRKVIDLMEAGPERWWEYSTNAHRYAKNNLCARWTVERRLAVIRRHLSVSKADSASLVSES